MLGCRLEGRISARPVIIRVVDLPRGSEPFQPGKLLTGTIWNRWTRTLIVSVVVRRNRYSDNPVIISVCFQRLPKYPFYVRDILLVVDPDVTDRFGRVPDRQAVNELFCGTDGVGVFWESNPPSEARTIALGLKVPSYSVAADQRSPLAVVSFYSIPPILGGIRASDWVIFLNGLDTEIRLVPDSSSSMD